MLFVLLKKYFFRMFLLIELMYFIFFLFDIVVKFFGSLIVCLMFGTLKKFRKSSK